MNLVRHELGLSRDGAALPAQGHLPRDLLARASTRETPLDEVLGTQLSRGAPSGRTSCASCSRAYVEAKQQQHVLDYDDLLLYWARADGRAGAGRARSARASTTCWSTSTRTPTALQAAILLRAEAGRRAGSPWSATTRSRSIRFRAATVRNILDFPAPVRAAGARSSRSSRTTARRSRSSTPPTRVIGLARERFTKNLLSTERAPASSRALVTVRDEAGQARLRRRAASSSNREAGMRAASSRRCCSAPSHHSAALELELARRNIPFVKFGGLKFLEAAHVKDLLAVLRWAENPRDRVAGFRVLQLLPGIGPATAARLLDAHGASAPIRSTALRDASRRRRGGRATGASFVDADARGCARGRRLAGRARAGARSWYEPHLERLLRRRRVRAGRPRPARADRRRLPLARALPHRAHARPAGRHQRRGRRAAARRGLPDPLDHPLGQGPGVEVRCSCSTSSTAASPPTWRPARAEEIEEERRLLYVAMTRAKDHLHLIVPQRFYVHQQARRGDRHLYASRTRFIPAAHRRPLRDAVVAGVRPRITARRPAHHGHRRHRRPHAPDVARHRHLSRPP